MLPLYGYNKEFFMQDNQRQTHWAYLAGILDADGCFMISKHSRNGERNRKWSIVESWCPTYMPSIKISMIEKEAIDLVTHEMGYGHYNLNGTRKDRPNSKPIYHWYLRGRKNISPFLKEVIPYLRVKKKRAEFLLDFCAKMKNCTSAGVPIEEYNYREESYVKMRELNGNKVAATTKPLRRESVNDSLIS